MFDPSIKSILQSVIQISLAYVKIGWISVSNSLSKVSAFKVLYSLIFELRLNTVFVAFADKSIEACFRLPVKIY